MPTAFTGGPYVEQDFTAATHQIMVETVADVLSAAHWKLVEKVQAWATVSTLGGATQPVIGQHFQASGTVFTFKIAPTSTLDIKIGTSVSDTLINLANAVNAHVAHITMTISGDTGLPTARWDAGGSFGNGVPFGGWLDWQADPTYDPPHNGLWLGGYKFKTNFTGTATLLPCIPAILYVYMSNAFDWAGFIGESGGGWPLTGVSFQMMSADQTIKGGVHVVVSGPGADMRAIASPTHLFLRRRNRVLSVTGAVFAGGSYYVNYDPDHPPHDAWWATGDNIGSPFFASSCLRNSYSDLAGYQSQNELCYNRIYLPSGTTSSQPWGMVPSLTMTSDNPGTFGGIVQPATRYGGDPFICEPMLLAGDTNTCGYRKYRGQIFDAITVCKDFATGFTSEQLANEFPWSDGSTLPDGITPKNRLSADFDQAKWENWTDNFVFGSLFIVRGKPIKSVGDFNYVYEGKA